MWEQYSKKLLEKIDRPLFEGILPTSTHEGMRRVEATVGALSLGFCAKLYLLVDETDGVIVDLSYTLFGPPLMQGVLEILSDLIIRKTYKQASRLSADLIEKNARDKKDRIAFPEEGNSILNQVICLIDEAVEQCQDIAIPEEAIKTPFSLEDSEIERPDNWEELSSKDKIAFIDLLLNKEVRPYIELDEGGVEILDLDNNILTISYQGACTSCYAATGSTLSAIQQIISAKVDAKISVVPKM